MSKRPDKRQGQAAVILGASGGLGRELAIRLAERGHVILSGRNKEELDITASMCKDPANITIIAGDLNELDTRNKLLSAADLYNIRYFVIASGVHSRINFPLDAAGGIEVLQTNVGTPIRLIKRMFPLLARYGGQIIHINSPAGRNTSPNEAMYSASKHAMAGFLKAFRLEARESGVRVLDVYLGAIKTRMMSDREDFANLIEPAEAAGIICSLLSTPVSTQVEEVTIGRFRF